MKRKLIIATALFFVCAVAIVLVAGHVFEAKANVPQTVTKIVHYELPALHKIKRLIP
jgi:hypothetical protein